MTEPNGLAAALAALQAQLPRVGKDATNPHFKSKYATLEAISAALLPVMAGLGLSFSAKPTMYEVAPGDWRFVLLYSLRHSPSGEQDTGTYPLDKGTPQSVGSAITYARRYALCAVTGLAPDDDDDGNEASSGDSKRSARSLTPAQQKAARTPDPARGQTPTEQRAARARRAEEVRAVAAAQTPGRPADRGPLPDADNPWQEADPEDRPGTALPGQKRAIEALLTKAGCATGKDEAARDERHAVVLKYLPGLEALKSMNHLSFNEAAAVMRGLSADTGDEKMPQTGPVRIEYGPGRTLVGNIDVEPPDHAQRAANDWPEDWPT